MKTAPKVVGLLCLGLYCFPLSAQSGFGDMRVGQPVNSIPFPCSDVVSCEGEYQSAWVRVSFNNGTISNIHVIYSGKTKLGDPIEMTPISLGQSVKLHSLQAGMKPPVFGVAESRGGAVFGIADTENRIVYITGSDDPASPVSEVVYVRSDAPVLAAAMRERLPGDGEPLVQAARSASAYANLTKAHARSRVTETQMSSATPNRIEVPQELRESGDASSESAGRPPVQRSAAAASAAQQRHRSR